MLNKDSVRQLIQEQGPLLPIQIRKQLGGDTLIIGAILSELLADKSIEVSKTRFGSSPAYYLQGQSLEKLISYLEASQQSFLGLLQEKKVLEDKEQTTEGRIALRQLPEFALSFEVKNHTYWRWHEISDKEGLRLVQEMVPRITKPRKSKKVKTKKRKIKKPGKKQSKHVKKKKRT